MFGREKTDKRNPPVAPKPSFTTPERGVQEKSEGLRTPSYDLGYVSRRTLLKGGSAALAGLTILQIAGPAHGFLGQSGGDAYDDSSDATQALGNADEEVLPWLDQPTENPFPDNLKNLLKWEDLDSWRTPTDEFFSFNHFGAPSGLSEATRHLDIGGLVARPKRLSLADLRARRRREVDFTLECSGNNGTGLDFVIGAIGNARWGGARLAPLLEEAGVLEQGTEVVFWGADSAALTIRDDSGIVAMATSSQRRMTLSSPAGGLSGRATDR